MNNVLYTQRYFSNVINSLGRDYRPIAALDRYDGFELDDDDYDAMSPGARAAAERELQRRDREDGTGRRDADGILYGLYYSRFL